jgi:DNA polymerase-3 subunit beta
MKTIVDQRTLRTAVDKAALFAPRKSTLPGLETITICANGKLEFRATDLETAVTVTVPLAAPVDGDYLNKVEPNYGVKTVDEGEVTVPVELFQKAVAAMREGCAITIDAPKATRRVQLLMGSHVVAQLSTEEKPVEKERTMPASVQPFYIEAAKLRAIAQKCAPFVSTDELRSHMHGVQFSYDGTQLTTTATNGHQLASLSFPLVAGEPFAFVVPAVLLRKAASVLTDVVAIRFTDEHIQFECDSPEHAGVKVTGRLIDEKFPNWPQVIPGDTPYTLTAYRTTLLGSIARLALFANSNTHQISLRMCDLRETNTEYHTLKVHAINYDAGNEGEEFPPADFVSKGETATLHVGFNAQLLRETLEALDGEEITAQFAGACRATIFREETELGMHALYLVMPVRLNDAPTDHLQSTPLAAGEDDSGDTYEPDESDRPYEGEEGQARLRNIVKEDCRRAWIAANGREPSEEELEQFIAPAFEGDNDPADESDESDIDEYEEESIEQVVGA